MNVTGFPHIRISLVNSLLALFFLAAMVHPATAGWIQYAPDATIELVSATYSTPEQGQPANLGFVKLSIRRTIHSSYLGGSTGFYSHVRWETFDTGSGTGHAVANTDYTRVYDDTIDGEDGSTGPVNRIIWFDNEPWVSTKDILIPISDDSASEGNETFGVRLILDESYPPGTSLECPNGNSPACNPWLRSPGGATLGSITQATVTINDNDSVPIVTVAVVDSASQPESVAQRKFRVSLDRAPAQSISVGFSLTGTATAGVGNDYTYTPTSPMTFGPSDWAAKDVTLTVNNDTIDEVNETVTLTLTDGANWDIGGPATLTIEDNDVPMVTVAVVDSASQPESVAQRKFRVSLDRAPVQSISVGFSLTGTATAGVGNDYTYTPTSPMTFGPSDWAAKDVTLTVNNDTIDEVNETVTLTLTDDGNWDIGGPATLTIEDNDVPMVTVAVVDSASQPESVAQRKFRVSLDRAPVQSISVGFSLTGTATAGVGNDYTYTPTSPMTFGPSDWAAKDVTLTVNNDTIDEVNETVTLTLTEDANWDIGGPATLTIEDNDVPMVTVAVVDNASQPESVAQRKFRVSLDRAPVQSISVGFSLTGTATAGVGNDYTYTPNSPMTFGPSDWAAKDVTLTVNNDTIDEVNETVTLTLTDGGNWDIGGPATLTIEDEDPAAVLTISSANVTEDNVAYSEEGPGYQDVTLYVTKSGSTSRTVTVPFTITAANAETGTGYPDFDLLTTPQDLVFLPAETSKEIAFRIYEDRLDEDQEYFHVNLTAPTGATPAYTLGNPSAGTVTIDDDDPAPALDVQSVSVNEADGSVELTLTVIPYDAQSGLYPGMTGKDIQVHVNTEPGTAINGQDFERQEDIEIYIPRHTGLTWAYIPITDDDLHEPTEEFTVAFSLSDPTAFSNTDPVATVTILDDDAPLALSTSDAVIDQGSLVRLQADPVNGFANLSWSWIEQENANLDYTLEGATAEPRRPLFRDQSSVNGHAILRVTAVDTGNGNRSAFADSRVDSVPWNLVEEYAPLTNLTRGGTPQQPTIHLDSAIGKVAAAYVADQPLVLWNRTQASSLLLEQWRDGLVTPIGAEPLQLLDLESTPADGEAPEETVLLVYGENSASALASLWDSANSQWGTFESLPGSEEFIGQAALVRQGTTWYAALSDGFSISLFQKSANSNWAPLTTGPGGAQNIISGTHPGLLAANSRLFLGYWNYDDGKLVVLCREGPTWLYSSPWPAVYASSDSPTATAIQYDIDARGNIWVLLDEQLNGTGQRELALIGHDSANATYTGLVPAEFPASCAGLLSGPGEVRMAADRSGWVHLLGADSANAARVTHHRLEARLTGTSPAVVAESSANAPATPITNRQLPDRTDRAMALAFSPEGSAFAVWQPSLFHEDMGYLAAREWKLSLLANEGVRYTMSDWIPVRLNIEDGEGVEWRLLGSDIAEIQVDGVAVGVGDWMDSDSHASVSVRLTADPHGPTNGRKQILGEVRAGSRALWSVRDWVTYFSESDVTFSAIAITDGVCDSDRPATCPAALEDFSLSAGQTRQLGIRFDYTPNVPLGLGPQDVEWEITDGIGYVDEQGVFHAQGYGVGRIVARRPQDGLSDEVGVTVGQAGELAYFEIRPSGETILGLSQKLPMSAVGRDFAGNPVPSLQPFWELIGPGSLSQQGLYLSPERLRAMETATVRVSDRTHPNIRGEKSILVDGLPPIPLNMDVLTMDGLSTRTVTGATIVTWELSQDPREVSLPVSYRVLLDGTDEIASLQSSETASDNLRIEWLSNSVRDGTHTLELIAVDRLGNSNFDAAPSLVVNVLNGNEHPLVEKGLDWLLRNQNRDPSAPAYVGSWKGTADRSMSELIIEAARAARALGESDLSYRADPVAGLNRWTGERLTVADAYHASISWLARALTEQVDQPFVVRAIAAEALAGAGKRLRAVEEVRGSVDQYYQSAPALVDEFISIEIASGLRFNREQGGFSAGEESRTTRFETIQAVALLAEAGRIEILQQILSERSGRGDSVVYTHFRDNVRWILDGTIFSPFPAQRNSNGWANDPMKQIIGLVGEQDQTTNNFYLGATIASRIDRLERARIATRLSDLLADGRVVEQLRSLQTQEGTATQGAFPTSQESPVDTAAMIDLLVLEALESVEPRLRDAGATQNYSAIKNPAHDVLVGNGKRAQDYLLRRRQLADGSWNGRALDTAYALQALRPELLIRSIRYDIATNNFRVDVANLGAIAAPEVRVSLLEESPEGLTPLEIASRRKATSYARSVAVARNLGESEEFLVPYRPSIFPSTVYLVVDATAQVAEVAEDNNARTWSLPEGPNLTIQPGTVIARNDSQNGPPILGAPWTLSAQLWNLGGQDVSFLTTEGSSSQLKIYSGNPIETASATLIWSQFLKDCRQAGSQGDKLSLLEAGRGSAININVPAGVVLTAGTYDLYLWIDHASGYNNNAGDIAETDESDNIASGVARFHDAGSPTDQPDLTLDQGLIAHQPQPFPCQGTTMLTFWLDNNGTAAAESVEVSVYTSDWLVAHRSLIPRIDGKRSVRLDVPIAAGLLDSQAVDAPEKDLRIILDPLDKIDEADEKNNEAEYRMAVQCGPAGLLDLSIAPRDVAVVERSGRLYPSVSIRNLGDSVQDRRVLITAERRTYPALNSPRGSYGPYDSKDIHPFALKSMGRYDSLSIPDSGPSLESGWVDLRYAILPAENPLVPASAWDAVPANNSAAKTVYTGRTDLRVVAISASEPLPPSTSCEVRTARVSLRVDLANGAGEQGLTTAENARLWVTDEVSGQVVGSLNQLRLEPRAASEQEEPTSGLYSFLLENIELSPGRHLFRAEVDPDRTFVETDERNNSRSLEVIVAASQGGTNLPQDLVVSPDDLYLVVEEGVVVLYGRVHHRVVQDDCTPEPVVNVQVTVAAGSQGETAIPSSVYTIPRLEPDGWASFAVTTGLAPEEQDLSAPLYDMLRVVASAPGGVDADPATNAATIPSRAPALPQAPSSEMFATQAYLTWGAAPDSPEMVAGYVVQRERLVGNTWHAEFARELPREARSFFDPGLRPGSNYRFNLYARGHNYRLSEAALIDVDDPVPAPVIAKIDTRGTQPAEIILPDPNKNPDIRYVQNETAKISVFYSDYLAGGSEVQMKLLRNATVYAPTGEPVPVENGYLYIFDNIPLRSQSVTSVSQNLCSAFLQVTPSPALGATTFRIYSNSVLLTYDNLIDLAFTKSADGVARFYMEIYRNNRWVEIPFHDYDVFLENSARLVAQIENTHNRNLPIPDFDLRFAFTYKDGKADERIVRVATADWKKATNGKLTVYSHLPGVAGGGAAYAIGVKRGKDLKEFNAKIDYSSALPNGRILELREANNELVIPYKPSFRPIGREFVVPLPLAWNNTLRTGLSLDHGYTTEPYKVEGIGYRFSVIARNPDSEQATSVSFSVTEQDGKESNERLLGSIPVPAKGRGEWTFPPDFELETRPWLGTARPQPGNQRFANIQWNRTVTIRATDDVTIVMWDPTTGWEDSTLLIPADQLNDRYTITGHYPSQEDYKRKNYADYPSNQTFPNPEENRNINFQYFAVTTTAEVANVTVTQNAIGVPGPVPKPPAGPGEQPQSYSFQLKRGQTYYWAPFSDGSEGPGGLRWDSIYQDPTGVVVSADAPISVATGVNGAIPSIDSHQGDHSYMIMHPSGVRGTEFYIPPAPSGSAEYYLNLKRYSNSFFRIVPTSRSGKPTRVWLDGKDPNRSPTADAPDFILNPGDYAEVTPMNPFVHSDIGSRLQLQWPFSHYLDRLIAKTGNEFRYVKRKEIEGNDFHRVVTDSDRPVLVTQYFTSSRNTLPVGWVDDRGECISCHYATGHMSRLPNPEWGSDNGYLRRVTGDPEFVSIIPKKSYTIDKYIPVQLIGGDYVDRLKLFPTMSFDPFAVNHDEGNGPIHFIRIVVAQDPNNEAAYIAPRLLYRRGSEVTWTSVTNSRADGSVVLYPKTRKEVFSPYPGAPPWERGYDWAVAIPAPAWKETGWSSVKSGYKEITLKVHVRNEAEREFEFYNPDNLRVMIIASGVNEHVKESYNRDGTFDKLERVPYLHSSYGHEMAYRYVEQPDDSPKPNVDLAVNSDSIRFVYTGDKIRPGQATPFVLEVANNGIEPSVEGYARIRVVEKRRAPGGQTIERQILPPSEEYEMNGDWHVLKSAPNLPVVILPGTSRTIGWLQQTNNPAAAYDPSFIFTPDENTLELCATVSHVLPPEIVYYPFPQLRINPMTDLVESNNSACKTVQVDLPDLRTMVNRLASGQLGTTTPGYHAVEENGTLTFYLWFLATEADPEDKSIEVRMTTLLPPMEAGGKRQKLVERKEIWFGAAERVPLDDRLYYLVEVPLEVTHPITGQYDILAEVDTGKEVLESNEANNTATYSYYAAFPRKGNIAAYGIQFNPGPPFYVGQTVNVTTSIESEKQAYTNVPVAFTYGDITIPGTAVRTAASRMTVPTLDDGGYQVVQSITFDEVYTGEFAITVNPDFYPSFDPPLKEHTYYDNIVKKRISVRPAGEQQSPDLMDHPDKANFARLMGKRAPFYRTSDPVRQPTLGSVVYNNNQVDPVSPFKAQIFDGSPGAENARVAAETILQPLAAGQKVWPVWAKKWDTSQAALGTHDLWLVIDSPEHLAARAASSPDAPSRVPLTARRLALGTGVTLSGLTEAERLAGVSLNVYALPSLLQENSALVGEWNSRRGFVNTTGNETSGTLQIYTSVSREPLLLVFETTNGLPFPERSEPWGLALSLYDDRDSTESVSIYTLPIALPANPAGAWGNRAAFWVAADGSTYFGRRLHLAGDFSAATYGGILPVDMTALQAMDDSSGSITESDEMTNNRASARVTIVSLPPDLKVARFAAVPAQLEVGQKTRLELDVENTGERTESFFTVRVDIRQPEAPQGAPPLVTFYKDISGTIETGEVKRLDFEWRPNLRTGFFTALAVIDSEPIPDGRILETDENNNTATTGFEVATTPLPLLAVAASPWVIDADEITTVTTTVRSNRETSGTMELLVYNEADPSGAGRLDVANQVPFGLNGVTDILSAWNSAANPAGFYRAKARLFERASGVWSDEPIEAISERITVRPDYNLQATVHTDKLSYDCGEPVRLTASVRNASRNAGLGEVMVIVKIRDEEGRILFPATRRLTDGLPRGQRWTGEFVWMHPRTYSENLTAELRVEALGSPAEATASAQFSYCPTDAALVRPLIVESGGQWDVYTRDTTGAVSLDYIGDPNGAIMMIADAEPLLGPGAWERNLFPNSGCEMSVGGTPSFWLGAGGDGRVAPSLAELNPVQGSASLQIVGSAGQWSGTKGSAPEGTETGIRVGAGRNYVLSLSRKLAIAGNGLVVSLVERDGAGVTTARALGNGAMSGTDWKREALRFTTGPETVSVGFRLGLQGQGSITANIDAIQLEEGVVATSWVDRAVPLDDKPTNLLPNPSLTLNEGRSWRLQQRELEGASDASDLGGIPDGWQVVGGSATISIVADAANELPPELRRRELHHWCDFTADTGSSALRAGLIPVDPFADLLLSVYAKSGAPTSLTLRVIEHDAAGNQVPGTVRLGTRAVGTAWQRVSLPVRTSSGAAFVAVELLPIPGQTIELAAAALNTGQALVPWTGWVPFAADVEPWQVASPLVEGEKRFSVRVLDKNSLPAIVESVALSLDENRDGAFDNDAAEYPSYTVTTWSGTTATQVDALSLFDGNVMSELVPANAVHRIIVEASLPGRPMVVDLVLPVKGTVPPGSTYKLEGGWSPGIYTEITTGPLVAGSLNLSNLQAKYSRYRLSLQFGAATAAVRLGDLALVGHSWDGVDNVVFDATPPTGSVDHPAAAARVGADALPVSVTATDEISGVSRVEVHLARAADDLTTWSLLLSGEGDSEYLGDIPLAGIADGEAALRARLTDFAGNIRVLPDVPIFIDRTPPVLTGAEIRNITLNSVEWLKSGDLAELRVSYDDETLAAENFTADLRAFGLGELESADSATFPLATWDLSGLGTVPSSGPITVRITASDPVGNVASPASAGIVADNIAPSILMDEINPQPLDVDTATLIGLSSDNEQGRVSRVVWRMVGATQWSDADPFEGESFDSSLEGFTFGLLALSDGRHCLEIRGIDAAGNGWSGPATEYCFNVGVHGPVIESVAIADMTNGSTEYARTGDSIRVTAVFGEDDLVPASIRADLSGFGLADDILPTTLSGRTATWSLEQVVCSPSDGETSVTVSARNRQGLRATKHDLIYTDNQRPVLSPLTVPATLVSSTAPLLFQGLITDEEPGRLASATYRLHRLGEGEAGDWLPLPVAPILGTVRETTFTLSVTTTNEAGEYLIPDGTWLFELRASDRAGWDLANGSYEHLFTIDRTAPSVLAKLQRVRVSEDQSLSYFDAYYVRDEDDLRVFARVDDSSVTTETLTANLRSLRDDQAGFAAVGADAYDGQAGTWMVDSVALVPADGPTSVTVTAVDAVGNAGSAVAYAFADNTPPTVTLFEFDTDNDFLPGVAAIRGMAQDLPPYANGPTGEVAAVQVRVLQQTPIKWYDVYKGPGELTVGFNDHITLPGDGTFTLVAKAIDKAGNEQPEPYPSLTITVDQTQRTAIMSATVYDSTIGSHTRTRDDHDVWVVAELYPLQENQEPPPATAIWANLTDLGGTPLQPVNPTEYQFPLAKWVVDDSATSPTTGMVHIPVWTADFASSPTMAQIFADNLPPVAAWEAANGMELNTAKPNLIAGITDEHSVIDRAEYRLGEGQWRVAGRDYSLFDPSSNSLRFGTDFGPGLDDGVYTVQARGTDVAGNASNLASLTFRVDTVKPIAQVAAVDDDPTSSSTVLFSGTLSDINGSGIQSGAYQVDETTDWTTIPDLTGSSTAKEFLLSVPFAAVHGTHHLRVKTWDRAGNESAVAQASIFIDLQSPILTMETPAPGSWHREPVRVQWNTASSDLTTSSGMLYRTEWNAVETTSLINSGDSVLLEGRYEAEAVGVDLAGNESDVVTTSFGIDLTSPTLTIDQVATWYANTTAQVTGTADDSNQSGVERVEFRVVGDADWTTATLTQQPSLEHPTLCVYSFPVQLNSVDTDIEVRSVDVAGNTSNTLSATLHRDAQAPQITITTPAANSTMSGTAFIISQVTDDRSGIDPDTVLYLIDQPEEIWKPLPQSSGTALSATHQASIDTWKLLDTNAVTVRVKASDEAGNNETTSASDANEATASARVDNDYPPQAPTGLTAAYISYTEVRISWNKATEGDLRDYRMYRKDNPNGTTVTVGDADIYTLSGQEVVIPPSADLQRNSFVDSNLSGHTVPYYWNYRLKAFDQADNASLFSIQIAVPPPDAPTGLRAMACSNSVDLKWNAVAEGFVTGYRVYRKGPGDADYVPLGLASATATPGYLDSTAISGSTYYYYVRALDGAENTSEPSNTVIAQPSGECSSVDIRTVLFESAKLDAGNDWDVEDVGVEMTAKHILDASQNVSSIELTFKGIRGYASREHCLYLEIKGLDGSATYTRQYWEAHTDPAGPPDTLPAGIPLTTVYDRASQDPAQRRIVLFPNSKASPGYIHNDIQKITLTLSNPSGNPLAEFDKVPYDLWLQNIGDQAIIHIYDPETGDYVEDNALATSGSVLEGVYINTAVSIPVHAWKRPYENAKIWDHYPRFVDYAKSYKTKSIKSPTWYLYPATELSYIRLEAEDADSYFDTTAGNSGGASRRGDIDIKMNDTGFQLTNIAADTTAGYNSATDEKVTYNNVPFMAGNYTVEVNGFSITAGNMTITIKVNGQTVVNAQAISSGTTFGPFSVSAGLGTVDVEFQRVSSAGATATIDAFIFRRQQP